MLNFEDKTLMETRGNVKHFLPQDCTKTGKVYKKGMLYNFLRKLQTTGLTELTTGRCRLLFCRFFVLPGMAET